MGRNQEENLGKTFSFLDLARHENPPISLQEVAITARRRNKPASYHKLVQSATDFNRMRSESRDSKVEDQEAVLEVNQRVTKNSDLVLTSPKTFYGYKDLSKAKLNQATKPECLLTSGEWRGKAKGLRSEISPICGWVTVDEQNGMFRKNAPETEIGKQKLTEEGKRKNRPAWMTRVDPSKIKRVAGNSYRYFDYPTTRSVYAGQTYRHNFDTKGRMDTERMDYLKPTNLLTPRAAGCAKFARDEVLPVAPTFGKWDERLFTSSRNRTTCNEVDIKPYSWHSEQRPATRS